MSEVIRTAGVAGTFTVTFSQVPVEPPTLTVYSDLARTLLAVLPATLVATANPQVWAASYPATLTAGRYYLVISARYTIGQPLVLDNDDVLVLTAPGVGVGQAVTLANLRTHLGYEDDRTEDDAALQDALDAALEVVEGIVGPLSVATYSETVSGSYGEALLAHYPIVSVTSPTGVTFSPSGRVTGLPYYGTTTIVYTAGQVPTAAQRTVALLIAQDIWETRRGQGFPQDDSGDYVETALLRRRARELLAPTRRGSAIG